MNRSRPLVLMYHGIATVPAEHDPHNLFVTPDSFEHQLKTLRDKNFRVVSLTEYLAPTKVAAPRAVLITFDDGYVSTLHTAAPLLAKYDMPAVCFVSPGLLEPVEMTGADGAFELLDGDGVRTLAAHNVAIGSHGWNHACMEGASRSQLHRDTATSRAALSDVLGRQPRVFAYPYGSHDVAARAAVREAGYELAFATHCGKGRFAVPRVDVNSTDTERSFGLKLQPWYPAARRALGLAPHVRRAAHRLIGTATRTSVSSSGVLRP